MTKPLALIIEDDPQLNTIMSITLQADFEIETYADGSSGLERLKHSNPKVVVLDLNLPGIPGREILQHIRADERLAKTRIIITTADERQAETLTDAADIVLLKPVSPAQLRELASRLKLI
ncbi:MAG TPA: response regulator [Anaerolineales bacterium]|nr:response regulator [Anaerolineales bacterium]